MALLKVPWVGLPYVSVVFPDYTHFLMQLKAPRLFSIPLESPWSNLETRSDVNNLATMLWYTSFRVNPHEPRGPPRGFGEKRKMALIPGAQGNEQANLFQGNKGTGTNLGGPKPMFI